MKDENGKRRQWNTEAYIEHAKQVHNNEYDYSKTVFTKINEAICVTCPTHGDFHPRANNHIHRKSKCPKCAGCAKLTVDEFVRRSKEKHGDKYDYSLIESVTTTKRVKIVCPEHGEFQQMAESHMNGHGCKKCGVIKCSSATRMTKDEFIKRARARFGDTLSYTKTEYVNSTTPVVITCPEHGDFTQRPSEHLKSTGCPHCSGLKPINRNEFIRRATGIHGDRYNYDKTEYTTTNKRVIVTCSTHGDFLTLPKDHLSKSSGCPKCAREQTSSKGESDLADWVSSLGYNVVRNDRDILQGFEIDIYIPSAKIGIEYNGSYWHTDRALKHPRIHEHKSNKAESQGVRLIAVWDYDWHQRPEAIKKHLLHALNLSKSTKYNARQCEIKEVTNAQCKSFYNENHLQGAPWRAMYSVGLFFNGEMVAAMSFTQGGSRRGKTGDHEWELIRYATNGIVRGGASKLFKHFIKTHSPTAVWSFSDRQHFGGWLYYTIGFTIDGYVPADYSLYHQPSGKRWHKSAWRRANIQARLNELGISDTYDHETDKRTERAIQDQYKIMRVMDAGKIRWKWNKKAPI